MTLLLSTRVRPLAVAASLGVGASLAISSGDAGADVPHERAVVPVVDDQRGLVVVGLGNSVDLTWPLARAVYADANLRPTTLDEAHARVLVGEAPGDSGTAELRDLADTRASIHGDDAASRRLLQSIALSLHVKGIVVVEAGATSTDRPSARVFVTTSNAYDAVHYDPDPPAPITWGKAAPLAWSGAVTSLHRGFGEPPAPPPPPPTPPAPVVAPHAPAAQGISALAELPAAITTPGDPTKPESRPFYKSPWFWAAAGAALFAAGAVYLATRSDATDNIQLQVQVPR